MVGVMEGEKASVSLQQVGPNHPFYDLEGSNNIDAYHRALQRISDANPKVMEPVQRYGNRGVFADLIKVSNI